MSASETLVTTATHEDTVSTQTHEPDQENGSMGAHEGVHLPPTSLWPITLALAITLMGAGLVTNVLVTIPGFLVFVWALRGWAKELLDAQH